MIKDGLMHYEHPDTKRQRKQKQRQEKTVVALFREYLNSCGVRGGSTIVHGDVITPYLNNDGWRRLFNKMDNDKTHAFYADLGNVDFYRFACADLKKEVEELCRKGDMGRARFVVKIRYNGNKYDVPVERRFNYVSLTDNPPNPDCRIVAIDKKE